MNELQDLSTEQARRAVATMMTRGVSTPDAISAALAAGLYAVERVASLEAKVRHLEASLADLRQGSQR